MRPFLLLFLVSSSAFAGFEIPEVDCQPDALAATVRQKTLAWKRAIEAKWCVMKARTAVYPMVVVCSKGASDVANLTTYKLVLQNVIEKAKVDIDVTQADVYDRALPHALVHAILPGCLPPQLPLLTMPAWITEGIAQSFVATLDEDARKEFGKKPLQPLQEFLFEGSRELSFYTQAGLLVRFLVDKHGGADKFKTFLSELGFEDSSSQRSLAQLGQYGRLFKKFYSMTISEMEEAFQKHVRALLADEKKP